MAEWLINQYERTLKETPGKEMKDSNTIFESTPFLAYLQAYVIVNEGDEIEIDTTYVDDVDIGDEDTVVWLGRSEGPYSTEDSGRKDYCLAMEVGRTIVGDGGWMDYTWQKIRIDILK
ncbi:hypothetical protein KFK09_002358 [Dendrobium nobile]|uniref:Uncharacterized protein n=1 Tax=Dendrobium nobile TaxID=94219 RepID=A0A8T3C138_DENNO|nr:hypothetical protein KFK09_002358 [Dendrobium nobile]